MALLKRLFPLFLIVVLGIWAFWPALHGGWIWDDNNYFPHHLLLGDPGRWWKTWLKPTYNPEYYPLTAAVEHLFWNLWHNETTPYHLFSLVFHLAGVLLLWWVLHLLGLRWGWLGALLFAVHPLNVESVAWLSEIKNTLSLPLYLIAIGLYLDYDTRGDRRRYGAALAFFIAAMLAKSAGACLPAVFLLYAWWKRGRVTWTDLRAVAPFFLVSLLLGMLNIAALHATHIRRDVIAGGDIPARFGGLGWTFSLILSKFLFPVGLAPTYADLPGQTFHALDLLPWLLYGAGALLFWQYRSSWGRHALLGFGFFFLNLVPIAIFILLDCPTMIWSINHLAYLSLIGLVGLVVAAAGLLAVQSHAYSRFFASNLALWTYAVQRYPHDWNSHFSLASAYFDLNQVPQAQAECETALPLNPRATILHMQMGSILLLKKRSSGGSRAVLDRRHPRSPLCRSPGPARLPLV